jgi:hypothetical protein
MKTWQQEGDICIRSGTKCVEVSFRKGVTRYGKGGKLSELTSNKHWLQGKNLYLFIS